MLQQRTDFLDLNLTCHFKPGLPEKCRNFCQQHKNNLVPHSSKSCSKGASPGRRGIVGLGGRGVRAPVSKHGSRVKRIKTGRREGKTERDQPRLKEEDEDDGGGRTQT